MILEYVVCDLAQNEEVNSIVRVLCVWLCQCNLEIGHCDVILITIYNSILLLEISRG